MARKNKRFAIVTDTHGDTINRDAEAEFFAWLKDYKPEIRIHAGDAFDLRALRRGASDEEASESIAADVEAGIGFMKRFRPHVWLMGNHDDRLIRVAKEHPKKIVRDYAMMIHEQVLGSLPPSCKVIPYNVEDGLCQVADMLVLHGYQCNLTTARWIAMQYGGVPGVRRVVQGHVHMFSSHTTRTRNQTIGHTIGGLCQRVMEYNKARPATMAHENGWAYGEIINGRTTFNEYHIQRELPNVHKIA